MKYKSILVTAGLISFTALPLMAGAITWPGAGEGTSPSFATTQQAALKVINTAITKLNAAEAAIQNNVSLSASTKSSILNDLNGIETQLLASKTEVEQATTNTELQAAYNEALQYLKTNKDAIKNDFKLALAEIGASASAKAEVYLAQIEQLLQVLKVTCPAQTSTITTLESQMSQLETLVTALNSAVKAKDSALIKTKISAINILMKSMSANIKTIQASCNIPSV